jgi:coenzyme F420-reducing hydrogenase alpha subunit
MSEIRRFNVKSLTRVEGLGALHIRVDDGSIEIAEFNIYEPPRFFERLLRGRGFAEVPDITARICGICPVAYQLTACQALEQAFGVEITPAITALRRLLYCGEWIQSHALHIHLLHAPDFLGYESGFTLAADRPEFVERGMRFKAIGSQIMEVVGGRAVHPVNVAVGGFYKAPSVAALRGLVPDLEWGLAASLELVREVAEFEFPAVRLPSTCVALRSDDGYPPATGRIISSDGLDIAIDDFERHFAEVQVPHSTALHTCNSTGDADHQPGRHDAPAFIGLANEGFDHLLGGVEVGNHAVTQGPHSANVAGGTAQHHLGLITHGQGHTPLQIHGHHRGLLEHDAFA